MPPWCLLLICLSCNLLRASADHFLRYRDEFLPHFLLAGVLAILLLSLRTRRISPVASSTASTTSTTSTASTTSTRSSTSTTSTRSSTSTTSTTSTTRTTITTANPQPRCNDGYTLYPRPGRSFCFRVVSVPDQWDAARTACKMENADLLVLDNESLIPFKDFMFQVSGVKNTWLGANTDGNLIARYVDGSTIPSNSRLWKSGEPSTPNECIFYSSSGLQDISCRFIAGYVCQYF